MGNVTTILEMTRFDKGQYCMHPAWKLKVQQTLGALQLDENEELINSLISLLTSECAITRSNAVYVLGELGPIAKSAVHAIVQEMIQSRSAPLRIVAVANIDPENAMPLLANAIDQLPHSKSEIFDWLQGQGLPALPYLLKHLAGYQANKAIRSMGLPAIPAILEHLKQAKFDDSHLGKLCAPAGSILSEFGAEATQPVIDALQSTAGDEHLTIVELIKWLKPPALDIRMAPIICRDIIEDRLDHYVGWSAISHFGLPVIPYVFELFTSANRTIYPKAFHALTTFDYAAIPTLTAGLSHANRTAQAYSAAAILKITQSDDREAVEKLVSLLGSDEEKDRLNALEAIVLASTNALSQIGGHALPAPPTIARWSPLLKILRDPNSPVRQQAERAEGEIGVRTKAALDQLMQSESYVTSLQELEDDSPAPAMPNYMVIRECLEREFPEGVVVSRLGRQIKNAMGEFENIVEETRRPVAFSAQQLSSPLSAHKPGQPSFFNKHIIVQVNLSGYGFRQNGGPPYGGSVGLFAYDGQRLIHLDGADATNSVGEVFRAEGINLDLIDPSELSCFFSHTVVPGLTHQHCVVEPSADSDLESAVRSPSVTRTNDNGWTVNFWTLSQSGGCSPNAPSLYEHTVTVSPQFVCNLALE